MRALPLLVGLLGLSACGFCEGLVFPFPKQLELCREIEACAGTPDPEQTCVDRYDALAGDGLGFCDSFGEEVAACILENGACFEGVFSSGNACDPLVPCF